jgi:hypothetical protein
VRGDGKGGQSLLEEWGDLKERETAMVGEGHGWYKRLGVRKTVRDVAKK